MKTRFKIEGRSIVTMDHESGEPTAKHVDTKFNLNISKNLNWKDYFDGELPNENGTRMITVAFVHGLIGNIHQAHQKGYWKDSEHIRYIIEELQKGFVQIVDIDSTPSDEDEINRIS